MGFRDRRDKCFGFHDKNGGELILLCMPSKVFLSLITPLGWNEMQCPVSIGNAYTT